MANGSANNDTVCTDGTERNDYVMNINTLSQKLTIIAILDRFRSTHVRSDFIIGEIVQNEQDAYTDILRGLDVLRNVVNPIWKNRNARGNYLEAANELILLTSQHNSIFMPNLDIPHRTYGEWNKLIEKIADSTYWDNIGKLTMKENSGNPAVTNENNERKWNTHLQNLEKNQDKIGQPSVRRSPKPTKKEPTVETIDSETSFVEELTSSESESLSDENDCKNRRIQRKKKSNKRNSLEQGGYILQPKEVVSPMKFDLDGSITMKRFLHEYEKYFYEKFSGGSHACTQELIKFLPPEVEKVYHALGGPELKFREMEEELIKWYSTTKRYGTRYYKEKLQYIRKEQDETLTTYARRLKQLGLKAYPNQTDRMFQEIRHRFFKTVPPYFRMKLENKEDMRVEMGKSKKIPWIEVVQLAEQEDKRRSRNSDHMETHYGAFNYPGQLQWYSTPGIYNDDGDGSWQYEMEMMANFNNTPGAGRGRGNYPSRGRARAPVANRGRQYSQQQRPLSSATNAATTTNTNANNSEVKSKNSSEALFCHWCGKLGHLEEGCWRKTGKCLICGSSDHRLQDCQSFKPNVPAINCSQCSGNSPRAISTGTRSC